MLLILKAVDYTSSLHYRDEVTLRKRFDLAINVEEVVAISSFTGSIAEDTEIEEDSATVEPTSLSKVRIKDPEGCNSYLILDSVKSITRVINLLKKENIKNER